MTRFFFHHDILDKADDLSTRRAAANNGSQIVFGGRKETCADCPSAVRRMRNMRRRTSRSRGDDADLAGRAVGEFIFPRGFAAA